MSTRLLIVTFISLMLITGAVLLGVALQPSMPVINTPPRDGWKITTDSHLVPLNGSCELHMPSGAEVIIPKQCSVLLQDCAVTLGQQLAPECDTLLIDPTQVSLGQANTTPTPSFVISPSSPIPVDCPSVGYVVHGIQSGDTLWDLSVRYQLKLSDLLVINHLTEEQAEELALGYPICIPLTS